MSLFPKIDSRRAFLLMTLLLREIMEDTVSADGRGDDVALGGWSAVEFVVDSCWFGTDRYRACLVNLEGPASAVGGAEEGTANDSGAGKVNSRRLSTGEKRDFHFISSGSIGMGADELCTRDCRRRTKREWAWQRATSFALSSSSSVVG